MPTPFQLISKFQPQGDQPDAIRQFVDSGFPSISFCQNSKREVQPCKR